MKTDRIIVTTPSELQELISKAVSDGISAAANQRNAKELMSFKETCQFLGVHASTLNVWKKEGRILYRRCGKRIFFCREEVLSSLKETGCYNKLKNINE